MRVKLNLMHELCQSQFSLLFPFFALLLKYYIVAILIEKSAREFYLAWIAYHIFRLFFYRQLGGDHQIAAGFCIERGAVHITKANYFLESGFMQSRFHLVM